MRNAVLLLVLLVALSATAHAGNTIVLKLDGIDGDSSIDGHKSWIDVRSFSWDISNTAAKPHFGAFTITKLTDSSSPQLLTDVASATHIASGTLDFGGVNQNGGAFIPRTSFSFSDIVLTDLSFTGKSDTDLNRVEESLSFTVSKFTLDGSTVELAAANAVPEPSSWLMLALGALSLGVSACRSRRLGHF